MLKISVPAVPFLIPAVPFTIPAVPFPLLASLEDVAKEKGGHLENRHGANLYTVLLASEYMKEAIEKAYKM